MSTSEERRRLRRADLRTKKREEIKERLGPDYDRRETERRNMAITPEETERILKQMGIADRRRGERRKW